MKKNHKISSPKPKTKALQIASVASMIDLFNKENIKILKSLGHDVDIATNFEEGSITSQERVDAYRQELKDSGIGSYQVPIPRKISKLGDFVKSYKIVKKLSNKNNYKIMHCHSPIGGVMARLAFSKARKRGCKVIYTAHGFHFYKGSPFINWLIYYPIEWLMAFKTDILITINKEDFALAKKHMHAKKIEYIPGVGIDVEKFKKVKVDIVKKRKELGLPCDARVILSVGELNKNKNHMLAIKALAKIDDENLHYLIVGIGNLDDYLTRLADRLGVSNQLHLAGYRDDIAEIYKAADFYIHPSFREGLPVALMEALASGTPSIASDIRGCRDLLAEDMLFSPNSVDQLARLLKRFAVSPKKTEFDASKYSIENVNKLLIGIFQITN